VFVDEFIGDSLLVDLEHVGDDEVVVVFEQMFKI